MVHENEVRYLTLLAEKYPSIQAASNEIINLSAQLQLLKGTEHFLSDVHGEHEAFQHVIRNGAGSIWRKIEEMFADTLTKREQRNVIRGGDSLEFKRSALGISACPTQVFKGLHNAY